MSDSQKEQRMVARVAQLPVLPSVVMQVMSLDSTDPGYFEDLVRIAEQDPTFAIRLLRVANAANSSPTKPILTVRQAAIRIGSRECAGLITAMAVSKVFVPRTVAQRNLWVHSVQTAVASRTISKLMIRRTVAPDHAYVAGLIHDIGRFVMFESAAQDLQRVDETHWHSPQEMIDNERALLGYDHVRVGALICRRWNMPASFLELVQLHHQYDLPRPTSLEASADLVRVVQMADLLSVKLMLSPDIVGMDPADLTAELGATCVRREWEQPPVSPSVLAQSVPAIEQESDAMVKALFSAA
ncbi:MAG: HDOD domain-containing protein [Gammaproteobacteria bacterium]|nr:HDOD domain-containing protein [Gammaproteobacteria bacterium]